MRFASAVCIWAPCILPLFLSACVTPLDKPSLISDAGHIETLRSPVAQDAVHLKKRVPPQKVTPAYPKNFQRPVNIQINEGVPLKEAIMELAHQSGVNLQLDPKIAASLVFIAQNRPLIEVLTDICDLGDLRFQVMNNAIRIEADTPYPVNYNIQFLNLSRTTDNRISIATDVFASVKEQKSSMDNGSNSTVSAKGETNFWTELEDNLKIILNAPGDTTPKFTMHRQGGLVAVRGTSKQHRLVENYLNNLRQVTSTQVLIEAKVIEVALKDEHKSGINWQQLAGGALRLNMPLGDLAQRSRMIDPTSAQGDILSFGAQYHQFNTLLKAINEFGASRTLSSPRVTVMNNQNAILKVAQNQVYFRLNYDKQYSLNINRESVSVSSDIMTVPIGLVMAVQPSIDHETGHIILSLRPTISRLSKSVSDPAVEIAYNATNRANNTVEHKPSLVPVVEVREIDSVLRLKSGEIAVLGGLMETRSANGQAKLPIAADIPGIGALFKATSVVDETVELVILLKATIIEDGAHMDKADQRLYEDYIDDPRPLYETES